MKAPEIRLDIAALKANFDWLASSGRSSSDKLPLMPVVKADAYGHGAVLIATALEQAFTEERLPYFCVARWTEAKELRDAGVKRPILVLSQYNSKEILAEALADVSLLVASPQDFRVLEGLDPKARQGLRGVHVHFNTGMNRLGFSHALAAPDLGAKLASLRAMGLRVEGFSTHLARAEEAPEIFTNTQRDRFAQALSTARRVWLEEWGEFPRWIHVANSAGLLRDLGRDVTAGRPGLFLWGVHQDEKARAQLMAEFPQLQLRPVLSMRVALRDTMWIEVGEGVSYGHRFVAESRRLVGILNFGYADGLSRALSRAKDDPKQLQFWIEGHPVPILGTVTMDMTLVDLTDHPKALEIHRRLQDEASLFWATWVGPEQPIERHAQVLNTISYELLCDFAHRVKRSVVQ